MVELNNEINEITDCDNLFNDISEWVTEWGSTGGYIVTNVGVGSEVDVSSITINGAYKCGIFPCTENEKFTIVGKGGMSPRLWCFTDSSYLVESVSDENEISDGKIIVAPADGYLIVNFNSSMYNEARLYRGVAIGITNSSMPVINVVEMGAKGDGETDDSKAIKSALLLANVLNKAVYFPSGIYVVRYRLGSFSNICIYGDYSDTFANKGSVILDKRPSMAGVGDITPLIELNGTYNIHDLTFFSLNDDGPALNNCLRLNDGWEARLTNVCVNNYIGRGINVYGMDITFDSVFVNACGSIEAETTSSSVAYAWVFASGANNNHITNCHIECCRFSLILAEARNNMFVNTKIEQSRRALDCSHQYSPVRIYANSSGNTFSACFFACMSRESYINKGATPVPFIKIENGEHVILNSNIFRSNRLNSETAYGSEYLESNESRPSIFTSNIFDRISENGIVIGENDVFTNNVVLDVDRNIVDI